MTNVNHYDRQWLSQQSKEHEISIGRFHHGDHVLHDHEFHELVIIEAGKGDHVIEKGIWPITRGDVYLIPRGISHAYRTKTELTLRNILFTDEAIKAADARLFFLPGVRALLNVEPSLRRKGIEGFRLNLDGDQLKQAVLYADAMEKELKDQQSGYRSVTAGLLIQLIVFLSRIYQSPAHREQSRVLEIAMVITHIETHADKKISLSGLSKVAGMSPRTLHRHFREALGMTPAQYLRNYRIKQVKELLVTGNASVTEIAYSCGFCDSSHLSQSFHDSVGISPRQYRRNVKMKAESENEKILPAELEADV